MAIKLRIMYSCILLLTTSLCSYADDFSISNYIISKQSSGNNQLVDIKIGWVTINLTSLDQNLTNDQRITACNSRERYFLDMSSFLNLVNFYYDFTSRTAGGNSETIRQMSQFLTRIFHLNASNIGNHNINDIRRINMDFFYGINLNNSRPLPANNNYGKKRYRKTSKRTNNAGSTDSKTIGFADFHLNPNDNLPHINNTGLALLLASFLEPWIHTNFQVANNPLATINDRLALTQQAFFSRVFQRALSSDNLSSTSTSPESTSPESTSPESTSQETRPQIDHEYNPFTFTTTENIVLFLHSTETDRDFVFATLLRSLSISFASHLIHRNVFLRESQSTPEGISRNYPAADTVQIVFWGYLRAYLQPRGVNLPLDCSFDLNRMQQMASDSQQLSVDFWANLAFIHQRLANEEATQLLTRLAGMDTTDAARTVTPAVANPGANQPSAAQRTIARLLRLNAQLNEQRMTVQASSEQSSDSGSCSVCLEKNKLVAILPCGHAVTCNSCATQILNSENSNCPMCRGVIQNILKLYF